MNIQKVTPNSQAIEAGQKRRRMKRVSFEKERNDADESIDIEIHNPTKSLPVIEVLKPAMKHITKEFNGSVSQPLVVIPKAPESQHEMTPKAAVPDLRRRRVKSMPAGSAASHDFFGPAEIAPSSVRKTSLDALEVLHEDRIVVENQLPKRTTDARDPVDTSEAQSTPKSEQDHRTFTVQHNKRNSAHCDCIIL